MAKRWTDLATWRGPTPNTGGSMLEYRGLVLHIALGYFKGTIDYQKNPDNQVSSHFVVGDGKISGADGEIAQVVETDRVAWTQKAGNGRWLSAEFAGFTPHPLTDRQLDAAAKLLARMHRDYGVPLKVAASPSDRGLAHHSLGAEHGVDWGHPDCPGPAIIAQQPEIVRRAIALVNGVTMATEVDLNKLLKTAVFPYANPDTSLGTTWLDTHTNTEEIKVALAELAPGVVDIQALAEALAPLLRPVVAEELAKLKLTLSE